MTSRQPDDNHSALAPGCLGVIHVPKSGGTAVKRSLGDVFSVYTGPLYYDSAHFGADHLLEGLPPHHAEEVGTVPDLSQIVKSHRAIIGHYAGSTLLAAGCTALAVQVREPRSRLLSLYRYWEGQTPEENREWGVWGSKVVEEARGPLKEFLQSKQVWPATDNAVSRQVASKGSPFPPLRRGRTDSVWRFPPSRYRAVGKALLVAHWDDQSSDFLAKIGQFIDVQDLPALTRENATQVRGETQEIDRETLHLLDRLTRADSQLLSRLMSDGLLERRSSARLDREFADCAERLGFRVVR